MKISIYNGNLFRPYNTKKKNSVIYYIVHYISLKNENCGAYRIQDIMSVWSNLNFV